MKSILHKKYVNVNIYNFIVESIIFLGFLFSPFIFWPKAKIAYEIPRVWFVLRWSELLLIFGSIGFLVFNPKVSRGKFTLIVLTLLFFLILIVSSLFGVNLQRSLWGNYYRLDGIYTYLHLFGIFLFFCFFWQTAWKNIIVCAVNLSSAVSSVWSIYLGMGLYLFKNSLTPNWYGAIGGFFGQPNFLGGYLLITLPFLYYWWLKKKHQWGVILLFALQSSAIILTFSIGAVIGLLLFIFFILLDFIKNRFFKQILIGTFLISIFFSCYFLTNKIFFTNSDNQGYIAQSRQRIIVRSVLAFIKRPILGWGWGNVDSAISSVVYPYLFKNDVYIDKAHSMFLEIMVTTGIIGLIIYVCILVVVSKRIIARIKAKDQVLWWKTILMVFLLYLFHSQTNVISIGEEIFFWFVLGITSNSDESRNLNKFGYLTKDIESK